MTAPVRDYSETLFLPKTDFPMRAGLPQKEPEILARWAKEDLYERLRETSKGRDKFVLHHGLPFKWKIEEENYRSKNKPKPNLADPAAMIAFRRECRAYAERWLNVQSEEFKRLGIEGDWDHPYTTMDFAAEAQIARELMKFAQNGTLYRGSKPVMWSVVEKTALAEAEVEYEDYVYDQVWVKFPVRTAPGPN